MEETENYTKVHRFLRTDLHLNEMMIRVFSHIFTLKIRGEPAFGQRYIAERCGLSLRETKKILKCLVRIGILREMGRGARGAAVYEPAISNCRNTTEAKEQLVHAVHQCTGAQGALPQCTRCTFNGAHGAPHIHNKYINKNPDDKYGRKGKDSQEIGVTVGGEFHGQDTL